MAMMTPRESWTDGRLDLFEKQVDERFDRVDERFDRVDERFDKFEKSVDERFGAVDKQLDRMDADIRELRQAVARMSESMNRNFIALAMLVVAAVVFF
jgi:archaellum component FlaC